MIDLFGKVTIQNSEANILKEIDFESLYKFNSTINRIEEADICLLIGVDPRKEAAILNLQLRKHFVNSNFKVANIGSVLNLTFPCVQLGSSIEDVLKLAQGQNSFCEVLKKSKKPMIIFGSSFFDSIDESTARLILSFITKNINVVSKNWNGINFLGSQASQIGCSEVGIGVNVLSTKPKFIYAIGDATIDDNLENCFIVYQGHQGNSSALKANLILPGAAYTEKDATYINIEGRAQKTQKILSAPGKAKEDVSILSAIISLICEKEFNHKFVEVENYNLVSNKYFNQIDISGLGYSKIKNKFIVSGKVNNFYLADPISKASPTMTKCSKQLLVKSPFLM